MHSILQLKNKLRKTKSADKTITSREEIEKAKEIKIKTKEIEIETKTTKTSTKTNAKTSAKTTIAAATTIINRKCLLKLREQFVCIYVSLALKIVSILLNYLLLFNNL